MITAYDVFAILFFFGGSIGALIGAVETYRNHKRLQRMAEACRLKRNHSHGLFL